MWAPWGGWRAAPTSYAGVCVNYSMTPRQRKYVNDFQSEYNCEYRPCVYVDPISDKYDFVPDYPVVKKETHCHWETPRVPPYHRVHLPLPANTRLVAGPRGHNSRDRMIMTQPPAMISARSSSSRSYSSDPHYDAPVHRLYQQDSAAMPAPLRRKLRRHQQRLRVENVAAPGMSSLPFANDEDRLIPHPGSRRRAHSAHVKRPNWRVLGSEGMDEPVQRAWMVKTGYDPNWKPLPNYSSAWSRPGLNFLPRSIDMMPTGTDWQSAHCRTRQERALLKQGW
ncbi:unnamed protein product [Amoebophrya sp. A120]|nr:unnamed protein product [Amoebophrya sp. A120]|eukprot:GSA120T00004863001.1